MKTVTRSFTLSTILAAMLGACSSAPTEETIGRAGEEPAIAPAEEALSTQFQVLSSQGKQDALLAIMEAFVPRAESFWTASDLTTTDTNYFAADGPGVSPTRGQGEIAYVYATLLTAKPSQPSFGGANGISSTTMFEHMRQDIRHAAYTYGPGGWGVEADGSASWQGALEAYEWGWAAQLQWNKLDSDTRQKVQQVITAEANLIKVKPPVNGKPGNTASDDNSWNGPLEALANVMFHNDSSASAWDLQAKTLAMNAVSRAADEQSSEVVDGTAVPTWISTVNLEDDYTLQNHGFFNPIYLQGAFQAVGDSMIFYAQRGFAQPQAFSFRLAEVWDNVLARLLTDDGDFLMPPGVDWVAHDYQDIPYLALIATRLQRADASVAESRAIAQLAQRQAANANGSLYGQARVGYEGDVVKNAAEAWWIHQLFGTSPQPTEQQYNAARATSAAVHEFASQLTIVARQRDAASSMFWGNAKRPATGLIVPAATGHLDDPVMVQYVPSSLVGQTSTGSATYSCDCQSNYFSTAGVIPGPRNFSMTSFPDGTAMLLDRGTGAAFDLAFDSIPGLTGARPVNYSGGNGLGNLPGNWANVADRFGVIVKGGAGLFAANKTSADPEMPNPYLLLEGSSATGSGNRGAFVLPIAKAEQTALAAQNVSQPAVSDSNWAALVGRALDGSERIAVARWGGASTLSIDLTSSRGAPIPDLPRNVTVNGSVATTSWTLGSPASTGVAAYFYVSSTAQVTVRPLWTDRIKIINTAASSTTVTVNYVDRDGAVRNAQRSLAAGQTAYAHALDQGVAIVVASASSTESPGTTYPAELVYDLSTGASGNFWVSAPVNLNSNPQFLTLDFGKQVDMGGLVMTPRVNYGPKSYTIQTSTDGSSWTPQADVAVALNSVVSTSFSPVSARYIRLRIIDAYGPGAPSSQVQVRELALLPPSRDVDAVFPQVRLAAGGWNTARVRVTNNDSTATNIAITASASAPITASVIGPTTVTVPANGFTDVDIAVSGATATTGSSTLTVNGLNTGSGPNAVPATIALVHTADLALNDFGTPFPHATASSVDPVLLYPPNLANDGDSTGSSPGPTGNYWVSGPYNLGTSPQDLMVDFGSSVVVGRVTVTPRVKYGPKSYTIDTSTNGTSWTTRATVTNGPDVELTTTFAPVSARYIRLHISAAYGAGPPTQVQVRELSVQPN